MADFATFDPIISNSREEMLKYHKDNKIPLPDNKYFNDYFQISNITEESSEKTDHYTPRFFNNSILKKEKEIEVPYRSFEDKPGEYKPSIKENNSKSNSGKYKITIRAKNSIAERHNNPGNLMFANQAGATRGESRKGGGHWARYPSLQAGLDGLTRQIEIDKFGKDSKGKPRNHTLSTFVNKYAPNFENDTTSYINTIVKSLNIPMDTPLQDIDTFKLAKIMAQIESSTTIE